MPKKILIFPFGGNARESIISILAINKIKREWDIVGFIDDNPSTWGKICCGIKVIGGKDKLNKFPNARILAIPGNPNNYLKRKRIIEGLRVDDSHFVSIAHPSAIISQDAKIGKNVLIMANVFISCGVKIGDHCVILPNTVISHEAVVGDYCCIGSNVSISGNVRIGQECYIGSGAKIRENIHIGKKTLIGIGSTVISDIKENMVAAGTPCRPIRKGK